MTCHVLSALCRLLLLLASANAVGLAAASAQDPQAPTAVMLGRVISRAGAPIAEAEVSVMGTPATILTDKTGSFRLGGIPPGTQVLRVRRIGFKGQFLHVTLAPGTTRGSDIMLDPGPQVLADITVRASEAKPIEFAWTTKYDDFFRRRALGLPGGTFISAEDIKRRAALHTYELIEQFVPGARVVVHCIGSECAEIQFPRCSRAVGYVGAWVDGKRLPRSPGYDKAHQVRFSSTSRRAPEGSAARKRLTELADALDQINPSEIQFMEVYRGIGSIPGEFSGGCGAIAIWTK